MAEKKMSVKIAERIAELQADIVRLITCLTNIKTKYEKDKK